LANPVILSSETHRNVRVITTRGAEFGENIHMVPVIGDELVNLVLDFPVYLIKSQETGKFGLNALLGFEPGENLYLQGEDWAASYLPLFMRRQPFLLAFSGDGNEMREKQQANIAIDMDSKRINDSEGEAIFNEDGSKTPYLENIIKHLATLGAGLESNEVFIEELTKHDLIEPTQLNVTFSNGDKKSFQGINTIDVVKLFKLKGDVLEPLNNNGFLQACYLVAASMGQVQKLVKMKNARLKDTA